MSELPEAGAAAPSMPSICCVLRTLNEEELVGRCIDTLRAQEGFTVEFVVVDSGSTDKTLEIVGERGVHLIEIDGAALKDFDYSYALNLGIKASSADLILILSAHTIPTSNDWLGKIVRHFDDERVVGVYCRQIAWPGAKWDEAARVERSFPDTSLAYDMRESRPARRFSNAASCIRRSTWEKLPFELPAAEDLDWAKRVVEGGWRIIYEAEATAYHSHDESARNVAQRKINLARAQDERDGRRRTRARTVKDALVWMWNDAKQVARSKQLGLGGKVGAMGEVLQRGFWFVREFR